MSSIAVAHDRGRRVSLTCRACGTSFVRLACQVTRGRGRYCSEDCRRAGLRSGVMLHCATCDTAFYRARSDAGRARTWFCCREHHKAWRAARRSHDTYPRIGSEHQHRVVAERVLRRRLAPDEVVHHIDGDKQNYGPSNLAVFPSQSFHARCHAGHMAADELDRYRLLMLAEAAA